VLLYDAGSGVSPGRRPFDLKERFMTKIICAADCGNSPKKLLLKDFSSALGRGTDAFVLKHLSDDVVWEWVGASPLRGKAAVATMLKRTNHEARQEMVIENILTHGSAGAANGTMRLTNGRSYGFCHVFEFSGAKGETIKRITSYEIRK
jgi:limonene-1,2-epoxide hydrolase